MRNISITVLNRLKKRILHILPVIDTEKERQLVSRTVEKLDIKTPNLQTLCSNLSGGNRQKVALGKWLERNVKLLIIENPTKGLDVGTRHEFYRLVSEMRRDGKTFLLISDDYEEIRHMCNRVLFMQDGKISGEEHMRKFVQSVW